MKLRRDAEGTVNVYADQDRDQKYERAYAGIAEQTCADDSARIFHVTGGRRFGDVADDGRPYSEIKKAVIPGDREDQDPDAKRGIPKPVQNERGKENAHQNICP